MIEIHPFRGIHYNPSEVKFEDAVVRLEFVKRAFFNHWNNIGPHSILRFYSPDDKVEARSKIQEYLDKKILVRDEKPNLYVYHQIFPLNGSLRVRRSFVSIMRLVDLEKGRILPHEEIFPGGKIFHLKIMEKLTYNIEQVLSLYSDPESVVQKMLDERCKAEPDFSFRDPFGTDHLVWKINEPDIILRVQKLMRGKSLVIADGHHRYEASLEYRDKYADKKDPLSAPYFRQMAFTNVYDPGLVILPTHRIVKGLNKIQTKELLQKLSPFFQIEKVEREKLHLLTNRKRPHIFGLYMGKNNCYILQLKEEKKILQSVECKGSENYKKLDVVILHAFILPRFLGVKGDDVSRIDYLRETERALEAVDNGHWDIAFLLQPTPPWMVKEIAEGGEKMPHKSTDFYPKLTAGLLMFDIAPSSRL